uniref:Thioredoxin domain-containing protein n=1 Tax=viral metagenome TaxID=1070528 RepID=A0A6C0BM09_9ZZZZ
MWIYILAVGVALVAGYLIWLNRRRAVAGSNGSPRQGTSAQVTEKEQVETDKPVVYELTDEDIPSIIAKEPNLVIMVFAPWCSHCRRMEPEFVKAAGAPGKSPCTWARLNAEQFPEAAKKLGADSFPTTFHFKQGKMEKALPGAMTAEKLLEQI